MNNPQALQDYVVPRAYDWFSNAIRLVVATNTFEIKPSIIQMIKQNRFEGVATKDPHVHLSKFSHICDTFKMNGFQMMPSS